jgi:transcription elongation factor Elf1
MTEKNKLFLVPTADKPTKFQCPKCRSRNVLVHHDPKMGTWFDWYSCKDCGEQWDVDEPFPVKITNVRIYPAKR